VSTPTERDRHATLLARDDGELLVAADRLGRGEEFTDVIAVDRPRARLQLDSLADAGVTDVPNHHLNQIRTRWPMGRRTSSRATSAAPTKRQYEPFRSSSSLHGVFAMRVEFGVRFPMSRFRRGRAMRGRGDPRRARHLAAREQLVRGRCARSSTCCRPDYVHVPDASDPLTSASTRARRLELPTRALASAFPATIVAGVRDRRHSRAPERRKWRFASATGRIGCR
jgi:hypothetical protein